MYQVIRGGSECPNAIRKGGRNGFCKKVADALVGTVARS